MKDKKLNLKIIILCIVLILVLAIAVIIDSSDFEFSKTNDAIQKPTSSINTNATELKVDYVEAKYTENYTAKIKLNDDNVIIEGSGVANSGNEIKISSGGNYYITGNATNVNILIDTSKNDNVTLYLDNCDITSQTTAPINCIACKLLTITLLENSNNTVSDVNTYTKFTDTEKQEPDGAIFTKTDLVINGKGNLTVNSNYQDGIVSKDTLQINETNVTVNSKDDGIRGKDYVAMNLANIVINAEGDGIKSTNIVDEGLGFIKIDGGSFNITSKSDGIEASTILNLSNNPVLNINSSENKGIKAGSEIAIENGEFNIVSKDDTVHSNGIIIINNGNLKLSSDDDGIHADTNIVINDGNINIEKSYEGIESSYIEINGGTINLVATDDGINVAGGKDSSSMMGRPGQNNFTNMENSNLKLIINNGNITVDAKGDGLDANGSIYIYGGNTFVKGPTSNGDAPLDFDRELIIDGGTVVAYGSSGMFESPSNNSKQNIIVYAGNGNSGDRISLKDSSENEIISFETEKSYQLILLSNNEIKTDSSYKLYVNDEEKESFDISSAITTNSNFVGGGMKGGGFKKGFDKMERDDFDDNGEFKKPDDMLDDMPGDMQNNRNKMMPDDMQKPPEMPEEPGQMRERQFSKQEQNN